PSRPLPTTSTRTSRLSRPSLHDALPISAGEPVGADRLLHRRPDAVRHELERFGAATAVLPRRDRPGRGPRYRRPGGRAGVAWPGGLCAARLPGAGVLADPGWLRTGDLHVPVPAGPA